MKQTNTTAASGGIGFTGLLTIAFIVLKLLNVITWSWLWVLSPMWISFGVVVLISLGFFLWVVANIAADEKKKKRAMKNDD